MKFIKLPLLVLSYIYMSSVSAAEGLVVIESGYTVADTRQRLEAAIQHKGLTLFEGVHHSGNASSVGLTLRPTELILLGKPQVGTKLMTCAPTIAIDLPQKILIWEDEGSRVWLAYNDANYLKARHDMSGCDEVIAKVGKLMAGLGALVAKPQ
ncbi:MAG: hypothetical protein ACI93R_004245 [Flavobacteriales bacterium]|jgi:uncharacterized protein (DUF302 family)